MGVLELVGQLYPNRVSLGSHHSRRPLSGPYRGVHLGWSHRHRGRRLHLLASYPDGVEIATSATE